MASWAKTQEDSELQREIFGMLTKNKRDNGPELSEAVALERLELMRGTPLTAHQRARATFYHQEWNYLANGAPKPPGAWAPKPCNDKEFVAEDGEKYTLRAGRCLKQVYRLPDNLAQVTGAKIMEYPQQVHRAIEKYIRDKKLPKDPTDPTSVLLDNALTEIFGVDRADVGRLLYLVEPMLTEFPGECPCCADDSDSDYEF